ncbi:hypothetical protein HYH03_003354 [Edaphochlamys debaryana]|uniref:Uncharacterized protein n=1 Tax=Edaphochlamys debaryana TaxID=47281 RepID=A0A835YH65_9CHLO|nr:hypothetical protein HYH03_003354 [Edaphochlamys debaryana]|eukprot:KAG2498605.1 hypothetical protein HYH03_003354 [Edaphochlamys debaryana]
MQVSSITAGKVRPTFGRRSVVVRCSSNGSGPSLSRPGGASRFSIGSDDDVPYDAQGDLPTIALRPSGGAFRGIPTEPVGTAGNVGALEFGRPGGGATRFHMPTSSTVTPASGPSSSLETPSRFSRPSGGGSRMMFPSAAVGGGDGGSTGGSGGSGGSGGNGGSGGSSGASPDETPLTFTNVFPWVIIYVATCAGLYTAHSKYFAKPPPKKACCGCKKSGATTTPAAPAAADGKAAAKGKK